MTSARTRMLIAVAVLCALPSASAQASESSVDAYAGQALILGSPSHAGEHGKQRSDQARAPGGAIKSRTGDGTHANRAVPRGGGPGSGPSTGGGSAAGGAHPASTVVAGSTRNHSSSMATSASQGGAGSAETSEQRQPPSIYPAEPAASTSLSGLDVLVIFAGLLILVIMALAIRRLSRTSSV